MKAIIINLQNINLVLKLELDEKQLERFKMDMKFEQRIFNCR